MSILTKIINAVVIILSLTLGFFFMFVGILKLTPALNEDTHEELASRILLYERQLHSNRLGLKTGPAHTGLGKFVITDSINCLKCN